jgi:hypothetical protein
LPRWAGRIHPVHLRIIDEETAILGPEDLALADELLAEQAPGLTYGELRHASRKLVLKLDPEGVRKQKEAAKRDTQVRRFRESSGNGGMVARELPSDEALASWQHIEQRALDLRAAGVPGTLDELRVRAYLDLLQERDSRHPAPDPAPAEHPAPADPEHPAPADPEHPAPADPEHPDPGPSDADSPSAGAEPPGRPSGPGPTPGPKPGPAPARDAGPSLAALVNITIPLTVWQGQPGPAGEADGYGPLDSDDARALAQAAARHPRSRWCLTVLNDDGTAAAHSCLPGRHPPPGFVPDPGPLPPQEPGPPPPQEPGPPASSRGPAMTPIARGSCDHTGAETGYHPSRKLQHLIRARNATCTAPGCSRPAARCDLDHTIPWDQGGPTCECDLAPLCRHHHRAKQAQGWHLEQPEPGLLVWRTPAGRAYASRPTRYPI